MEILKSWQVCHIYMFILKKIFSRTSRPIAIKLGTNHPWVKEILVYTNKGPGPLQFGIQIYSNEGSSPLQRGDNHKNAKVR
jgi:hypothetical protein